MNQEMEKILASLRGHLEIEKAFGIQEISFTGMTKKGTLASLEKKVLQCTRCRLSQGRKNAVFGEGSPRASLLFIGEGPGYHEDLQGRPFVGRAGQLLDRILSAMGLAREEVYIANMVKCRPPGDRTPLPDEIDACRPYLEVQISLIQPKVICLLGSVALKGLLGTDKGITAIRGQMLDFRGIPVIPTFHPAFLLRNPGEKRKAWEDFQKVMKLI